VRHTTAHVGRRLHLILRSGVHISGRLIEITDRHYTIEGYGRVERRFVRSLSFERKQPDRGGFHAVRH
jgi:hypothetical protein